MTVQHTITASSASAGDPDEPGSSAKAKRGGVGRSRNAADGSEPDHADNADDPDRRASHTNLIEQRTEYSGEHEIVSVVDARSLATADAPRGIMLDTGWLQQRLMDAIAEAALAVARVTVQICDDSTMTELHVQHCGIPASTDVLTFDATQRDDAGVALEPIEVDIAVCIDEAARHVAERPHEVQAELLLYALHGVLHAAGFNDHDAASYEAMHAEEDRILTAIGVGAVFHSGCRRRKAGQRAERNMMVAKPNGDSYHGESGHSSAMGEQAPSHEHADRDTDDHSR